MHIWISSILKQDGANSSSVDRSVDRQVVYNVATLHQVKIFLIIPRSVIKPTRNTQHNYASLVIQQQKTNHMQV